MCLPPPTHNPSTDNPIALSHFSAVSSPSLSSAAPPGNPSESAFAPSPPLSAFTSSSPSSAASLACTSVSQSSRSYVSTSEKDITAPPVIAVAAPASCSLSLAVPSRAPTATTIPSPPEEIISPAFNPPMAGDSASSLVARRAEEFGDMFWHIFQHDEKAAVKFLMRGHQPGHERFQYQGEMMGKPPGSDFSTICYWFKRTSPSVPDGGEVCLIWPRTNSTVNGWDFKREIMSEFDMYRLKEAGQLWDFEEWGIEEYLFPSNAIATTSDGNALKGDEGHRFRASSPNSSSFDDYNSHGEEIDKEAGTSDSNDNNRSGGDGWPPVAASQGSCAPRTAGDSAVATDNIVKRRIEEEAAIKKRQQGAVEFPRLRLPSSPLAPPPPNNTNDVAVSATANAAAAGEDDAPNADANNAVDDEEDEAGNYENNEDWGNLMIPGETPAPPPPLQSLLFVPPSSVTDREKTEAEEFEKCFKCSNSNSSTREMLVGEIPRIFSCFHYPETNHSVPVNHDRNRQRNSFGSMELIDCQDKVVLFRWDLLGVLVRAFLYVSC